MSYLVVEYAKRFWLGECHGQTAVLRDHSVVGAVSLLTRPGSNIDTDTNVVSSGRSGANGNVLATSTSTPVPTPTPMPAATPTPTATPVPTATPDPTPTPMPAATATPIPTATPDPTPTPPPAATTPTATPVPTATPDPTPTPMPTATPTPTATPRPTATPTPTPIPPVARWEFETFTPRGYSPATVNVQGTVWGVPSSYTDDSDHGAVAYMLLGTIKGCNFANEEADRNSIVYVRVQEMADLTSYVSAEVCRFVSESYGSFSGLRITHIRFFDESSPSNIREYVYQEEARQYVRLP